MIKRLQKEALKDKLLTSKLILLKGPRKIGKLSLLAEICEESNTAFTVLDCADKKQRKKIESGETSLQIDEPVLILQEAQYLSNLQTILEEVLTGKITSTLVVCCSYKPLIDEELLEAMRIEGMEFELFAPSFYESAQHFGLTKEEELLEERLIYGNYPTVLNDLESAEATLRELMQEVLDTQLGAKDRVNKADKLMRMLQLLAFEIGEPVSYNEIGERCGLDNETVERYIGLLEEAHLLVKLPVMFSGHRYELKKTHCIYFQDNGIRNVLISNFNPTHLRNDLPELWKNYLISERVKWIRMNKLPKEIYFWRTHTRQQMDFIEKSEHKIMAYKMDWEKRKKVKIPPSFVSYYPEAKASLLNKSTYWNFLTRKA